MPVHKWNSTITRIFIKIAARIFRGIRLKIEESLINALALEHNRIQLNYRCEKGTYPNNHRETELNIYILALYF